MVLIEKSPCKQAKLQTSQNLLNMSHAALRGVSAESLKMIAGDEHMVKPLQKMV